MNEARAKAGDKTIENPRTAAAGSRTVDSSLRRRLTARRRSQPEPGQTLGALRRVMLS
jgi:NAD-dependent DNA ligase